MLLRVLLAFLLISSARAEGVVYKDVAFDDVFHDWDKATKADPPGLTIMEPQTLHFTATFAAAPRPCKTGVLQAIMTTSGMPHALDKIPISHCIALTSAGGRKASIFVQDVLVPGLEHDATVGDQIDISAVLLGYFVEEPRSCNAPVMLLNRFEPIELKKG